jgi:vanillate/3-O-methylgallate O-demethylase
MHKPHISLQDLVDATPDLVGYFYNETLAPHFRARTGLTAAFIPPEFTNWRDEQRGWRDAAVLFDQSHHMPELYVKGPDALKLLTKCAINSLANFGPDRAKQFVACTPRGHVVGDCIAYWRGENDFVLVSGMTILNWVRYQGETGGYDVSFHRDDPTPFNPTGRRINWRFQIDGPNAGAILADLIDGGSPELPFFRTARATIQGMETVLLRHGMAGHQGAELSGPYDDYERIRSIILEVGKKHGLVQAGTKAYFSTLFESGWMAYPLPGIYTGEELRGFREWLPADGWEGNYHLGGSFLTSNIEDYYVTPWDVGYGKILKFDHDFIGREALAAMADKPKRAPVTLEWNKEDVLRVWGALHGDGPRYKWMELPVIYYGFPHADEVRSADGRLVGVSVHAGYSNNEGQYLSLAMIAEADAQVGSEVVITWGEPGGGSRKPHVERHEQTTIRAKVCPNPYAAAVRRMKTAAISKS